MLLSQEQIKQIIPHRDPFLLIDEVLELAPGTRCVAGKHITGAEDFFRGHFPDYPVMPGVLILEAMAQAGAVAILSLEEYKGKIALFAGADNVKWKRQVRPGDELRLEVSLQKAKFGVICGEGTAYVGDAVVCTAGIKCAVQNN